MFIFENSLLYIEDFFWNKNNKFEWTLNNSKMEKIISTPIWATNFVFCSLSIVPNCSLVQYQGKILMQPWENSKNPNFGPNLGPQEIFFMVLPQLVLRQCSKLSSYAISRKANKPNLKKQQKTQFQAQFLPALAQIWSQKFFCGFYL